MFGSKSGPSFSQGGISFEVKKMIAFIKQESLEKAREIYLKANEDFEIEKAKLVLPKQAIKNVKKFKHCMKGEKA